MNGQVNLLQKMKIREEVEAFYKNPIAQVSSQLLFTIALVVFFAIFAIRPTLLTMTELLRNIEEKRQIDSDLGRKIAALSTLNTEITNLRPQIQILDAVVPNSPSFENALLQIEKIASQNSVQISAMQSPLIPADIPARPESAKMSTYALTFTTKGGYTALKGMLDDFRTSGQLITLESITIARSQTTSDLGLHGTIVVHYYGTPQPEVNK